jgi:solute carrier family 25 (mitochondrial folate transporter), member 32
MEWYYQALSGFVSSAVALSVISPIEVLKSQTQVTGKSNTVKSLAKNIYQKEGVRGFYKGLGAALATQPTFWTMYFPTYKYMKDQGYNKYLSSYLSGGVGIVASNPLWVLRTRFQTEVLRNEHLTYPKLVNKMLTQGGVKTFYRGTGVTLIKNTQIILQFPLYEELKYICDTKYLGENSTTFERTLAYMGSGALAKIASSSLTYPMDVMRTNLRLEPPSTSWMQMIQKIHLRKGGYMNFYRGIGLYLVSSAPVFAITMGCYEFFNKKFT